MAPPPADPQFNDTVVVEPIRFDTVFPGSAQFSTSAPPSAASRVPLDDTFPENTDDWDATRMVSRPSRARPWNLTFPDGSTEDITSSMIVGRAATEMDDWPGARLISVPDQTRSISKNHAAFAEKFGMFVVEDLGSTNGIVIVRPDGAEHVVPPFGRADVPEGSVVELGAVVLRIGRAPAPAPRF
ncbi:MAG: FHA domain-containing protein [Microbacteriaceae bacterium]